MSSNKTTQDKNVEIINDGAIPQSPFEATIILDKFDAFYAQMDYDDIHHDVHVNNGDTVTPRASEDRSIKSAPKQAGREQLQASGDTTRSSHIISAMASSTTSNDDDEFLENEIAVEPTPAGGARASNWAYFLDVKFVHIVVLVPSLSALACALPDVYFMIYLVEHFKVNVGLTGIFRAALVLVQILGTFANMAAPRASAVTNLILSIAGFSGLYFFGETSLFVFVSCNLASNISGYSEFASVLAKVAFVEDLEKSRIAYSMRDILMSVGMAAGVFLSGAINQWFGIKGVALTGALVQSLSFMSLCHYLFLTRDTKIAKGVVVDAKNGMRTNQRLDAQQEDDEEAVGRPSIVCYTHDKSDQDEENASKWSIKRLSVTVRSHIERALSNEEMRLADEKIMKSLSEGRVRNSLASTFTESKQVQANRFVKMLPIMFAFDAVTAGSLRTIVPIFISETFQRAESEIGLLISIPMILGVVVCFLAETDIGSKIVRSYAKSPNDLCIIFTLTAVFMLLLLVPLYPVQIISIGLILTLTTPMTSALTELQGAITTTKHFRILGPIGRVFNLFVELVVSAILPLLYKVWYLLPYTVTGLGSAIFALFFVWMVKHQDDSNAKKLAALNPEAVPERPTLVRLSFASREIFARMIDVMHFWRLVGARMSRLKKEEDNEVPVNICR